MQNGLAVHADERDALAGNGETIEKSLNGGDVGVGDDALEFDLRLFRFAWVGDHGAERRRCPLGVGKGRGGTGLDALGAVAHDQRHVDSVHRGPADDADRSRQVLLSPRAGRGSG